MTWTNKYKKSIDCNNPKGFSQKAHCQARKLRQAGKETKSEPVNETRKLTAREKLIRGLKRGGYDVEERAKYWENKKKELERQHAEYERQGIIKPKTANEDAPVNSAGGGQVAGIGVGPQGEPGVQRKKKVASFISFMTRQGKR